MSLEVVVRSASATNVLKNQQPLVGIESQDDEAYIEWGSGPLSMAERNQVYDSGSFNGGSFDLPDFNFDDPPPPEEVKQFYFDEIQRQTHTVRITNPTDPSQYVDVEVIDQIAFNSVFGIYIYRFKNPM